MTRRILRLLAFLILCALSQPAWAQDPKAVFDEALKPIILMTNAIDRQGDDLSGIWTYSKDRYKVSFGDINGSPPEERNKRYRDINVEAEEKADPMTFFEFDMQRAPRTQLPGSWNMPNTELRFYDGLMWYQRTFVPTKRSGRAFIRFEAANNRALVYVNGKLVGSHVGGFTPFTFEVTDVLRDGENQITVGVDSTHTDDDVPPVFTDWDIYGGITRPVRLIYTPDTYIDDAFIRLNDSKTIETDIQLNGKDKANQIINLSIKELGLKVTLKTNAEGIATLSFKAPATLKLWSPETPKLYDVEIKTASDTLTERMGFRTIKVKGTQILLNDKPIFMRGISMHEEEFGRIPLRIITPQAARALLNEAKIGLNANFIRLSHYPHSEVTVRMADEIGLLVWSEIPVYWSVNFKSDKTLNQARKMMAENILRDRNRASVVIWSVGNETPISPERTRFQSQLADDTRALDPSRLISAAMWASKKRIGSKIEATIEDPLASKLDILAINTYMGWYGDNPLSDIPLTHWNNKHNKPLILSEFGADAMANFHDPVLKRKYSEEFQADFYRKTLDMADRIEFLAGVSPWILKDFQTPRREHPVYQNGWNRKGVVSETGERKLSFYVLSDYYKKRSLKKSH
jgi:beta-glucuronidase